jgi:two-component system response regulator AtoC
VEELGHRPWPGNIRELRNVIARAAILARGRVIRTSDLSSEDQPGLTALTTTSTILDLRVALAETEQRIIRQALDQSNWNRTQAARLLGISRRQLFDKIRLYGLHH